MIHTPTQPEVTFLAIAFFDLSDFMIWSQQKDPMALFELMDAYATLMDETVEAGGGLVLKHMGDDGLAVFPGDAGEHGPDNALATMMKAADVGAGWLKAQGIRTSITVRLGLGEVAFGPFRGQMDALGPAVNETVMMKKGRLSLTPAFHASLSGPLKGAFKSLDGGQRFERVFD